ncbi:RNA-directed DNA polymerase [Streptomyces qinzhouensis]|uniref:RNA-directed DNA polymerase n=1 Tax=Streptomyces qinzhouensis TaxID=2599401 RepID=UPI00164727A9|nr:RNA-directed DNA polymerase [Streptomyces qinzhouensis]
MENLSVHLDTALRLLISGQEFSEIPDVATYAEIKDQWSVGCRDSLEATIRDGDYGPQHTEIVDYPKNAIAVRPLTRFSARDRLIYDSLVFDLASDIDKCRNRSVYSYRWNHKAGEPLFWSHSWSLMRHRALSTLSGNRRLLMATLDVSSFYEHVDVELLSEDLYMMAKNEAHVQKVSNFLRRFQNINHAWGLPQGSDASGILANAYLASVDQFLTQQRLPFVRYSDDIMIFDESWNSLRDVLVSVNRIFRARKLSMAGHKTSILGHEEALNRLRSAEEASIDYGVKVGDPKARLSARTYFYDTCASEVISSRRLKFSLNRLRRLGDDYAVSWCLDNIRYIADAAKEIFAYFAACEHRLPEIESKLTAFMCSSESKSYPYVEQRILRYFVRLGVSNELMKESAWKILDDRNREEFPREFAARYLGRCSSVADAQLLRHKFEGEAGGGMRRALMIALYESGYLSKRYRRDVECSIPNLRWLCSYLEKNPKIPVS